MSLSHEISYMLGVVAVGFAVNYTLRALPFLIFAGKARSLPSWVVRFDSVISPIIIAGLIVYSYSGLAWRTGWPYLAGLLTVGLHLWRRNALVSIVAGTALYMFLVAGCSTPQIMTDARNPSVSYTLRGVELCGEVVTPQQVVRTLKANGIPKDRVIHIRLSPEVKNLMGARTLLGVLAQAGYTSPVLVMESHGESYSTGRRGRTSDNAKGARKAGEDTAPRKIRYKRNNSD